MIMCLCLQILDAIDTPTCQRLEQPDVCPKDYYNLMHQCWQHEPVARPSFNDIFVQLPIVSTNGYCNIFVQRLETIVKI